MPTGHRPEPRLSANEPLTHSCATAPFLPRKGPGPRSILTHPDPSDPSNPSDPRCPGPPHEKVTPKLPFDTIKLVFYPCGAQNRKPSRRRSRRVPPPDSEAISL